MRSTATVLPWSICEQSEPIVGGQIAMPQAHSGKLADRYQRGVGLRRKTPREKHADLLGPSDRDPVAILAAGDRTRISKLIPVRYERMLTSPFAFLRGAAAVMAQDLNHQPRCGPGLRRLPSDELRSFRHPRGKHSFRHQ